MIDVRQVARLLHGVTRGNDAVVIDRIRPVASSDVGGLAFVYSKEDLKNCASAKVDILVGPPGTKCAQAKAIVEVNSINVDRLNGLPGKHLNSARCLYWEAHHYWSGVPVYAGRADYERSDHW
jgi:hypothetical protein